MAPRPAVTANDKENSEPTSSPLFPDEDEIKTVSRRLKLSKKPPSSRALQPRQLEKRALSPEWAPVFSAASPVPKKRAP